MAKKTNTKRKIIALVSELTGHRTYVTRKNTMNTPEKLELRKYDPKARKHVKYVETKKYARMIEFLYSNALRNEAINILYYISPAFRLHKCIKMQRLWLFSFNFSEAVTFSMYMGQSNYLFLVQDLDKMVSSFQISFMSEIYTYLYT